MEQSSVGVGVSQCQHPSQWKCGEIENTMILLHTLVVIWIMADFGVAYRENNGYPALSEYV